MSAFSRVKMLIGQDKLNILQSSHVAVFGIGGVGGYTAEALVRSGIGEITIVDNDAVSESNLNRQIIATVNTLGKDKVAVMEERLLSINPNLKVHAKKLFYLPETAEEIDFSNFSYVVDAVDTVSAKLEVVLRAKSANVPVISCMGSGGKTDITALKVADIKKTEVCPLARVMRRELKVRGVKDLKVVFSTEQMVTCEQNGCAEEKKSDGKKAPPSMIFVPSTAGLMLAREVVFDLTRE
jgi:tRNA A37 threonylcarbamoyladenosine dehydratase